MVSDLKDRIRESTRAAMRNQDKARLSTLRLINAEIKQAEVDSRSALADQDLVSILIRMQKQRTASATQYREAGRSDLETQENYEIAVIQEFLPKQLTDTEIHKAVDDACENLHADSMQHMGKVMGLLTKSLSGRADMGLVSKIVRTRLSAS